MHKYLYANGNPVKYSDPSGNMFCSVGSAILSLAATTYCVIYNNLDTLHVMGMVSGVGSAAITQMLGGSSAEITSAFLTGYFMGFALGTLTYVVVAYEIFTIVQMTLLLAPIDTITCMVMTIGSIMSGNKRQALIYGTLSIISLFTFCKLYNMSCTANIVGDKGTARIEYDNPAEPHGNSKSSTKPQHGYEIYNTETGDVVKTGISGRPLNKNGTSPRANVQVNMLNKKAGYEIYDARVVEVDIPDRALALEWEKSNALRLWQEGNSMSFHKRPQPWK